MEMTVNVVGFDEIGLIVYENGKHFHIVGVSEKEIETINDTLKARGLEPLNPIHHAYYM